MHQTADVDEQVGIETKKLEPVLEAPARPEEGAKEHPKRNLLKELCGRLTVKLEQIASHINLILRFLRSNREVGLNPKQVQELHVRIRNSLLVGVSSLLLPQKRIMSWIVVINTPHAIETHVCGTEAAAYTALADFARRAWHTVYGEKDNPPEVEFDDIVAESFFEDMPEDVGKYAYTIKEYELKF